MIMKQRNNAIHMHKRNVMEVQSTIKILWPKQIDNLLRSCRFSAQANSIFIDYLFYDSSELHCSRERVVTPTPTHTHTHRHTQFIVL